VYICTAKLLKTQRIHSMKENAMPLRIQYNHWRNIAFSLIAAALAGCSALPNSSPVAESTAARPATVPRTASNNHLTLPPAGSGRGGYYLDDGPGDNVPEGLLDMPDAEPQVEPYSRRGNNPYVVFGKKYTPITDERPFRQRGVGSWYGRKFHGQKTSSGELYDMYKMSAAHPTLPIPSYARVTNVTNGKQVIVRVNDRGPFHSSRVIDLSYVAALKLGYLSKGSSQLEVERLLPDDIARIAASKREQPFNAADQTPVPAPKDPLTEAISPVGNQQAGAGSVKPVVAPVNVTNAAVASAPGFYIQLGAYSRAANAETVRAELMQNWANTLPPIEVVENGSFYRLHSGPFATRADAAIVALQLQNAGAPKAMIVQR
jgi:rare lipoprotein A